MFSESCWQSMSVCISMDVCACYNVHWHLHPGPESEGQTCFSLETVRHLQVAHQCCHLLDNPCIVFMMQIKCTPFGFQSLPLLFSCFKWVSSLDYTLAVSILSFWTRQAGKTWVQLITLISALVELGVPHVSRKAGTIAKLENGNWRRPSLTWSVTPVLVLQRRAEVSWEKACLNQVVLKHSISVCKRDCVYCSPVFFCFIPGPEFDLSLLEQLFKNMTIYQQY